MVRENCSPQPDDPPARTARGRAADVSRSHDPDSHPRHHLPGPTKTSEGYGFSDSELHLLCPPETTSRGHGCPGTLLERTHDGNARAPPARATQPLRLLGDPAQGPMDRLLERD